MHVWLRKAWANYRMLQKLFANIRASAESLPDFLFTYWVDLKKQRSVLDETGRPGHVEGERAAADDEEIDDGDVDDADDSNFFAPLNWSGERGLGGPLRRVPNPLNARSVARVDKGTKEKFAQYIKRWKYDHVMKCQREFELSEIELVGCLNAKQKATFDEADYHLLGLKDTQLVMFLTGGGGTGKSKVIEAAKLAVTLAYGRTRGRHGSTLAMAPTGNAAHNVRGVTWQSGLARSMSGKVFSATVSIEDNGATAERL